MESETGISLILAVLALWIAYRSWQVSHQSLLVGVRALEVARGESNQGWQARSAKVIPLMNRLRGSLEIEYGDVTVHNPDVTPNSDEMDMILESLSRDLEHADELVLRSSEVDLEAAAMAEHIRRDLWLLRYYFKRVKRSADKWAGRRASIIQTLHEAYELLNRLEQHFPESARLVGEFTYSGYAGQLLQDVQTIAKARSERTLEDPNFGLLGSHSSE